MAEERLDDDEEMVDQFTEDDPVDRAMRVATASKLEMEGYSTDEDDAFDEEVVYAGNRSASRTPARWVPPFSEPSCWQTAVADSALRAIKVSATFVDCPPRRQYPDSRRANGSRSRGE